MAGVEYLYCRDGHSLAGLSGALFVRGKIVAACVYVWSPLWRFGLFFYFFYLLLPSFCGDVDVEGVMFSGSRSSLLLVVLYGAFYSATGLLWLLLLVSRLLGYVDCVAVRHLPLGL